MPRISASGRLLLLAACAVLPPPPIAHGAVLLQPGMRTIGAAMKGIPVKANTETELFSFPPGEAGVLTEQWFSVFGGDHPYVTFRVAGRCAWRVLLAALVFVHAFVSFCLCLAAGASPVCSCVPARTTQRGFADMTSVPTRW